MSKRNLVWLTLDSIRGDRTSIGGHTRDTTPTLAAIGAQPNGQAGTCFSHAIWSQPSVASMMTGTYLSTHGSGSHNETLPEEIPTVADRLSKAGYHTVGVSSNAYFSSTTGTDRGFDRFDFLRGKRLIREAGIESLISFVKNLRTFSAGFEFEKRKHDANFLINEVVKDRLRTQAQRDDSFFLAAHYPGAHHPYYPSPVFQEKFSADLPMSAKEAAELVFDYTTDVYSRIAEGHINNEDVSTAIEVMYDSKIAQVDALINELLEYIDQLGISDETILIVTSDHGDLLGEMGLFSHKLVLHDALIKVPIAIQGSDYLADSELGLAQHADIMKTVLSELGVPTSGMQGVQLQESTRDEAVAQRGSETHRKTMDRVREYNPDFDHNHVLSGFVTAIRTEDWKYVASANGEILYKLPCEEENVAGQYPKKTDDFQAHLERWRSAHSDTIQSDDVAEFDDKVRRLLNDLGYIEE